LLETRWRPTFTLSFHILTLTFAKLPYSFFCSLRETSEESFDWRLEGENNREHHCWRLMAGGVFSHKRKSRAANIGRKMDEPFYCLRLDSWHCKWNFLVGLDFFIASDPMLGFLFIDCGPLWGIIMWLFGRDID